MTIQELVNLLNKLNMPNAVIDIASDEEGNSFGDISPSVSEGKLKDGRPVISLYPENSELPEDRYDYTEQELKDYYSGKTSNE